MGRITDEDKTKIRDMYTKQGKTLREIAEAVGDVSKQCIWYHVNQMELEQPDFEKKLRKLRKKLKMRIKSYLRSHPNSSISEVADHFDCSTVKAKSLLVELGHYEEPVPFMERVDVDNLIRLYVVEDLSLADLGEKIGSASELTISKALKELGVPLRPQGASTGKIRKEWRKRALSNLGLN